LQGGLRHVEKPKKLRFILKDDDNTSMM
jgi:hypothetical protein